ncbi:unnamed protein product [Anisakis simplex]|uniref:DUF4476 domain-containing protein n=1 Tax=Anisakis simplex TaxID=6269 RepID=A0A0M3KEC0_ANISI|nr:unnamed protein product [Anisakis simplex]
MSLRKAFVLLKRLSTRLRSVPEWSRHFFGPTTSTTGYEPVIAGSQVPAPFHNDQDDGSRSPEILINNDQSELSSCIRDLENSDGSDEAIEDASGSSSFETDSDGSDVLPKEMTRKEIYAHDGEIKQAKQLGVGFASQTAESLVLSAIRERSASKKSFSDLNVALFNMHNTKLADALIKRNVGSLCLIESAQNNAKLVKVSGQF